MGNSDSKSQKIYENIIDPNTGEFRDSAVNKLFNNDTFKDLLYRYITDSTENKYASLGVEKANTTLNEKVQDLEQNLIDNYITKVESQNFVSKVDVNSMLETTNCKAYCVKDGEGKSIGVNDFFNSDASNGLKDAVKEHMTLQLNETMNNHKVEQNKIIENNHKNIQNQINEFEIKFEGKNFKDTLITEIVEKINKQTNKHIIPRGTIVSYEKNGEIPEGWVVCDGKNGTPDLRDRFIVGEKSMETFKNKDWDAIIRQALIEKMKENGDIPETFMDRPTSIPTSVPTTKPKKESNGNDFINFFTGGGKEQKPPEPYSLKFIMKT